MHQLLMMGAPPWPDAWDAYANTFLAHFLAQGMPASEAMTAAEAEADRMVARREVSSKRRREAAQRERAAEQEAERQKEEEENRKLRGPRLREVIPDPTVLKEYVVSAFGGLNESARLASTAEQLGICHSPGCPCPDQNHHWSDVPRITRLAALCAAHGFPVKWREPAKPEPKETPKPGGKKRRMMRDSLKKESK